MTTDQDRVFALLVESNPIPQIEDLDLVDVGATRYLATLEQRSSGMTRLDQKTDLKREKKPSPMTWLVAAIALVILGVVLVLVNQGSDEAPVVTEPTPTTVNSAESLSFDNLFIHCVDNLENTPQRCIEVSNKLIDGECRLESVYIIMETWLESGEEAVASQVNSDCANPGAVLG